MEAAKPNTELFWYRPTTEPEKGRIIYALYEWKDHDPERMPDVGVFIVQEDGTWELQNLMPHQREGMDPIRDGMRHRFHDHWGIVRWRYADGGVVPL